MPGTGTRRPRNASLLKLQAQGRESQLSRSQDKVFRDGPGRGRSPVRRLVTGQRGRGLSPPRPGSTEPDEGSGTLANSAHPLRSAAGQAGSIIIRHASSRQRSAPTTHPPYLAQMDRQARHTLAQRCRPI